MTDGAYDAVLYVSFGGPERPADVVPFLENVTRGRGIPRERLEEVGAHYRLFGGRSPINERNREVVDALRARLAADGPALPVYVGNRNWHPFLAEALHELAADGHRRVLAFVTAAFSSWSGCRQYRENLAAAVAETGVDVEIDKIRVFFNHPGFVAALTARVRDALGQLPPVERDRARLVFVTHAVPRAMARHSDYEMQHLETSRLVAAGLGQADWDLVYCSRSGPPQVPWTEPDIGDHLARLHEQAPDRPVVLVPIGFLVDHMEVVYDLDVQAREVAERLGLTMVRAATVGAHPAFVDAIRELIRERTDGAPRRALGTLGAWHDACPADCCLQPGQTSAPTVAAAPAAPAAPEGGWPDHR